MLPPVMVTRPEPVPEQTSTEASRFWEKVLQPVTVPIRELS